MVSLNIYKNSANKFGRKTGFKIENEIEDQDQSIPKLKGILTQVFCTFGPNLVLAWTGDELSCRQAQNGVTFDFEVKFDLEGVIARTSWGLTHTHGHTHRQTQATTIPEGQNWPRVIMKYATFIWYLLTISKYVPCWLEYYYSERCIIW